MRQRLRETGRVSLELAVVTLAAVVVWPWRLSVETPSSADGMGQAAVAAGDMIAGAQGIQTAVAAGDRIAGTHGRHKIAGKDGTQKMAGKVGITQMTVKIGIQDMTRILTAVAAVPMQMIAPQEVEGPYY